MFREDLRLDWRWDSKLYELRDEFRVSLTGLYCTVIAMPAA